MAKTLADIEKKLDTIYETEKTYTGRGWKFWVFTPMAVAAVAGCVFLVVRRLFGGNENQAG